MKKLAMLLVLIVGGLLASVGIDLDESQYQKSRIFPNSYIITLKVNDAAKKKDDMVSDKETVNQVAERLIEGAKKNQIMIENRDGAKKITPNIEIELKSVWGHAMKGFSAILTDEAVIYLKNDPIVESVHHDEYGKLF